MTGEAKKSIVPGKYSGKYKNRTDDALTNFINEQCADEKGKVDFDKFFQLASANGVNEAEIEKYRAAVASKAGGAGGRARMTIGNMLNGVAAKGNGLKGIDGTVYDVKARPAPQRVAKAA